MSDDLNKREKEALEFAKKCAEKLREIYLTEGCNPDNPARLNLVELCYMIGGDIELTGGTSYEDYVALEAREGGRFLVRLKIVDHLNVKYESSLQLAFAIGDWFLNFQDAEPGAACRTGNDYKVSNSLERRCAVRFGWNLLLPAELFESTWWLYDCNAGKVADALDIYAGHVTYRARQLELPETPPVIIGGSDDTGTHTVVRLPKTVWV